MKTLSLLVAAASIAALSAPALAQSPAALRDNPFYAQDAAKMQMSTQERMEHAPRETVAPAPAPMHGKHHTTPAAKKHKHMHHHAKKKTTVNTTHNADGTTTTTKTKTTTK